MDERVNREMNNIDVFPAAALTRSLISKSPAWACAAEKAPFCIEGKGCS